MRLSKPLKIKFLPQTGFLSSSSKFLNLSKRHTRPNPQLGITGGIVEKEMPIHLSNVMIWNSSTKKQDKISFKEEKGKKMRVFRSTGKDVK